MVVSLGYALLQPFFLTKKLLCKRRSAQLAAASLVIFKALIVLPSFLGKSNATKKLKHFLTFQFIRVKKHFTFCALILLL
jgi:hypothetical protein